MGLTYNYAYKKKATPIHRLSPGPFRLVLYVCRFNCVQFNQFAVNSFSTNQQSSDQSLSIVQFVSIMLHKMF